MFHVKPSPRKPLAGRGVECVDFLRDLSRAVHPIADRERIGQNQLAICHRNCVVAVDKGHRLRVECSLVDLIVRIALERRLELCHTIIDGLAGRVGRKRQMRDTERVGHNFLNVVLDGLWLVKPAVDDGLWFQLIGRERHNLVRRALRIGSARFRLCGLDGYIGGKCGRIAGGQKYKGRGRYRENGLFHTFTSTIV